MGRVSECLCAAEVVSFQAWCRVPASVQVLDALGKNGGV